MCSQSLSRVRLFATPWTVAHQALLSMEFSGQEYWSGLPFPSPGDLPDLGIECASLRSPALTGRFFTSVPPEKPSRHYARCQNTEKNLVVFVEMVLSSFLFRLRVGIRMYQKQSETMFQ